LIFPFSLEIIVSFSIRRWDLHVLPAGRTKFPTNEIPWFTETL